jgi:hypothetical protein
VKNQEILNKYLDIIPELTQVTRDLKNKMINDDIPNETEQITKPKEDNKLTDQPLKMGIEDYISKLNYSDVGYENVESGENMRNYATALSEEDPNEIEDLVNRLVGTFRDIMNKKLKKDISATGMSKSWAYWDVGKQLYMYSNPNKSNKNYKLGNPLEDKELFWDIVYRMIGWEITKGGVKPDGSKYSSWELKDIGKKSI